MGSVFRHAPLPALVFGATLLGAGCSSAPRSTRLQTDDLQAMAIDVAAQLRASSFLQGRTPDSPRMTIAVAPAENLSSDILTEAEKWFLVERVADSVPIQTLGRDFNAAFVVPADKARAARASGAVDRGAYAGRNPTHRFGATLQSLTRAAGRDRTDLYVIEYRIVNLDTAQIEWSAPFEFKRAAKGKAYD